MRLPSLDLSATRNPRGSGTSGNSTQARWASFMSETYDPYFKWLGIPKADQPPHGYRLLGIELFESDADVISNAADGRMAQIKSFQTGKFAAVSQKLLNEIAAAKICLLNPAKEVGIRSASAGAFAREERRRQCQRAATQDVGSGGRGGRRRCRPSIFRLFDGAVARTARPAKKKGLPAWVIPAGVGGRHDYHCGWHCHLHVACR